MTWLAAAAWAAAPLAFLLELSAARRTLRANDGVVEAWLCAGARPLEVLARVRGRVRPAILIAMALIVPTLVRPEPGPEPAVLWGLCGVVAAALAASIVATLRTFVDSRLVDRAPAEAKAPFRLRPCEPPASVEVFEARPPDDGSP